MIPVTIDHNRFVALRTVVKVATKYVNITERNDSYEWWEERLKEAEEILENLRRVHVRDANENGTCEKCNADAYTRAERQKEHRRELDEFDACLTLTGGINERTG